MPCSRTGQATSERRGNACSGGNRAPQRIRTCFGREPGQGCREIDVADLVARKGCDLTWWMQDAAFAALSDLPASIPREARRFALAAQGPSTIRQSRDPYWPGYLRPSRPHSLRRWPRVTSESSPAGVAVVTCLLKRASPPSAVAALACRPDPRSGVCGGASRTSPQSAVRAPIEVRGPQRFANERSSPHGEPRFPGRERRSPSTLKEDRVNHVISTRSNAPIGVLLGGTGRAPAPTCRHVVVPMLFQPWPGDEPGSMTSGLMAHQATPHNERRMRSETVVHPDRDRSATEREALKHCRPFDRPDWGCLNITPA